MKIEHMRIFIDICRLQSISKAAEANFSTQPNLSKILCTMENELQMTLLKRTNKGIVLTEDGREFLQTCHDITKRYDEFLNSKTPWNNSEKVEFYTTPAMAPLFMKIFDDDVFSKYIFSINERNNDELFNYILEEQSCIVVLVTPKRKISELKTKIKGRIEPLWCEKSTYFVCHRDNNLLNEQAPDLSLLKNKIITTSSYANEDYLTEEYIKMNDFGKIKKLLRERDMICTVPPVFYNHLFEKDKFPILTTKNTPSFEVQMYYNLGTSEDSRELYRALLKVLKTR